MSCFGGKMREYDQISIDRFDNFKGHQNLRSTVYFLSHFHKDHTVGLSSERFLERMKLSRKVFIYCTEVTKILMLADDHYKHLGKYVRTLEVDVPTRVTIPDEYTDKDDYLTVTLIPAGHCPGSVMFLFEGSEGIVLYTGDFRWEGNQVTRVPWFKSGDSVKDIRSLYVDTTFCIPEAFYIPSRVDCVDALYDLVKDWIAESPNNFVNISSKTSYGHEHLLKGVADKLGTKVHILPEKYKLYEQISELKDVFTSDPAETPIHACWWKPERDKASRLPCGFVPPGNQDVKVMTIRPSTMWFTQGVQIKDIYVKTRYLHRVCYSFHSSFSEVRELVTYLKPRRAFPNVKPMNHSMDQVQARLNQFLSLTHKAHAAGDEPVHTKPLGILRKVSSVHKDNGSLTDSEELCFDEEKTPKKRRRRASTESLPSTPDSAVKFSLNYSQFLKERTPDSSQEKGVSSVISPTKASDAGSSYTPSHHSDSELDLTVTDEEEMLGSGHGDSAPDFPPTEGSCLTYISGDEDDEDLKEFVSQNKLIDSNTDSEEPVKVTGMGVEPVTETQDDVVESRGDNAEACAIQVDKVEGKQSVNTLDISDGDSDVTLPPETSEVTVKVTPPHETPGVTSNLTLSSDIPEVTPLDETTEVTSNLTLSSDIPEVTVPGVTPKETLPPETPEVTVPPGVTPKETLPPETPEVTSVVSFAPNTLDAAFPPETPVVTLTPDIPEVTLPPEKPELTPDLTLQPETPGAPPVVTVSPDTPVATISPDTPVVTLPPEKPELTPDLTLRPVTPEAPPKETPKATLPPVTPVSGEPENCSDINSSPDDINIVYSSVPPRANPKPGVNGANSRNSSADKKQSLCCEQSTTSRAKDGQGEDDFWARLQDTGPDPRYFPEKSTNKRRDSSCHENSLGSPPGKVPRLRQSRSQSPRGVIHSPVRPKVPVPQKVILVDLTLGDSDSDDEACVILSSSKVTQGNPSTR